MPEPAESPTVSVPLAEVARIAGVGRAAVSNWRRRHETFPAPIGGTDASPVFSLAEIEAWLHREGKIKTAVEPLERLWPEYEALGDRDAMGFLVAQVGLRLCGEPGKPDDGLPAAAGVLDERQSGLLERTLELAGTKGPAETFGFLLERWLRTHVRQIAVTPGPLAELVTDIAAVVHAGCGPHGSRPRVRHRDPASVGGTAMGRLRRRLRTGRAARAGQGPGARVLDARTAGRRQLHRGSSTGDHSHGRGHPARRCPCGCTGRCGPVQPARERA